MKVLKIDSNRNKKKKQPSSQDLIPPEIPSSFLLLFYLEIFHRLDFELQRGVLVANEESTGVLLDSRDSPHVVDSFFNSLVEGQGFMGTCN